MGEEHEVHGSGRTISQLRRNQRRKCRHRHQIHLRQTILSHGVIYGGTRRAPQSPQLLRRREAQACGRLDLSTRGSGEGSGKNGEERALWKDNPPGLRNFSLIGDCFGAAYSGTEIVTSFPSTILTNRKRLSLRMMVTTFSPSSISRISCPLIPSYFAKVRFT